MSTAMELLPAAAAHFGELVHGVDADRWSAPTPCTRWTVRDLLDHLVTEHLWVPHLLRGETLEQVGDRYDGPVLGTDPVAAWDAAITPSMAAWSGVDDPGQPVHLSIGPTPAAEYAEQMLLDLTVHAWDLARGAGLDERLDPDIVRHVLAYATPVIPRWQGLGFFDAPLPAASDDPRDELLALLGRRV